MSNELPGVPQPPPVGGPRRKRSRPIGPRLPGGHFRPKQFGPKLPKQYGPKKPKGFKRARQLRRATSSRGSLRGRRSFFERKAASWLLRAAKRLLKPSRRSGTGDHRNHGYKGVRNRYATGLRGR